MAKRAVSSPFDQMTTRPSSNVSASPASCLGAALPRRTVIMGLGNTPVMRKAADAPERGEVGARSWSRLAWTWSLALVTRASRLGVHLGASGPTSPVVRLSSPSEWSLRNVDLNVLVPLPPKQLSQAVDAQVGVWTGSHDHPPERFDGKADR